MHSIFIIIECKRSIIYSSKEQVKVGIVKGDVFDRFDNYLLAY